MFTYITYIIFTQYTSEKSFFLPVLQYMMYRNSAKKYQNNSFWLYNPP